MKDFNEMNIEERQAYVNELYNQLTPENKAKALNYYQMLLAEQEKEA